MMMSKWVYGCCVAAMVLGFVRIAPAQNAGDDIVQVFARAARGEPLRYVVIGGSITQSGEGWIGSWLKQQFPRSDVTVVNAGMSATGSNLGIFRIERDVIAFQPDLVGIEYCVNDSGLSDEDATRYMESLVVRLKQLPNPPAILVIEAAMEGGVNLKRHRRVAQHYGLLEVDLQAAVDKELSEKQHPWLSLFSDAVHLNDAGNAFYARIMSETLQPLVQQAASAPKTPARRTLPAQLSAKPLILDGRMISLSRLTAPGWRQESFNGQWWGRFFSGMLAADQPGTVLKLPLRGSTFGLLFEVDPTFGSFYLNVDDAQPICVPAHVRKGYEPIIAAIDLPAGEHVLNVVLPAKSDAFPIRSNGVVRLGYALVAGSDAPGQAKASLGEWSAERLSTLQLKPVRAEQFSVAGPYPAGDGKVENALSLMKVAYSPETPGSDVAWQSVPEQPEAWLDLRKLAKTDRPSVMYAKTKITSDKDRAIVISLAADYYAKLWVNGQPAAALEQTHGAAQKPWLFKATLKAGENDVLLKVSPGAKGFGVWLATESAE